MDYLLNSYYENNAKKLHTIINQIFIKHYGGINGIDIEEFYGIGTDVLTEIWEKNTYDFSKGNFDGYVYKALRLAIIDELKKQNRDKYKTKIFLYDENGEKVLDKKTGRPIKIIIPDVRLDEPVNEEGSITQGDILKSDFNIEDIIMEEENSYTDEKVRLFLDNLSNIQRKIVEMKMEGLPSWAIKKNLHLSDSEYNRELRDVKVNENWSIFSKNINDGDYKREEKTMEDTVMSIDDANNYRMDKNSLFSLLEDKKNGEINCKYILQRKPFQWNTEEVNRYIARILNNLPIPEIVICEQKINGKNIAHLIDGLQRLSYAEAFKDNRLKIGEKGAERRFVQYREYKTDSNGNRLIGEDGYPVEEIKVCDIVGKKYRDLPKDLQKRFNKFNINVTKFFNCTDGQIADHIRDYNNHASMNKEQGGITKIDTKVALKIKEISEKSGFFLNCGKFSRANKIKGKLERVVAESIMLIFFRNNWKANLDSIYKYINDNCTDEQFDILKSDLNRLEKALCSNENLNEMFTVTKSPMWITVFHEFTKFGLSDERFIDFLKEYNASLKNKKINGVSMEDFKNNQTKKKATITGKIDLLVELMIDFLHINNEFCNSDVKNVS